MPDNTFDCRPLRPFGVAVDFDLRVPLTDAQQQALRDLLFAEGLLLFRGQQLSDCDHDRVMNHFGPVLVEEGEYRVIDARGNLGASRLLFHSDLAFTTQPFKLLSLYGLEIVGQTSTLFASGTKVMQLLPAALREQVTTLEATTTIPPSQAERAVTYETPAFLPQTTRPMQMPHPITGVPILFVCEQQTSRVEGLAKVDSEALLQELFGFLYSSANVLEHRWELGDLVIWDNIALQHARADQTGIGKRRLRRVAVADKTFFQLCPQFSLDDPRIQRWASGGLLDA